MWLDPAEDPRDLSPARGEKGTVLQYLRNYRLTFELKCQDLDAEQMARRAVSPSTLSLLGLLRHLAQMEHHWSVRVLRGVDTPQLYKTPEDREADLHGGSADPAVVEEAWATWRQVGAEADAVYAAEDWDRLLGDPGTPEEERNEVRDVIVHVLEEYARHVGHADLLRECIDGRTGQ